MLKIPKLKLNKTSCIKFQNKNVLHHQPLLHCFYLLNEKEAVFRNIISTTIQGNQVIQFVVRLSHSMYYVDAFSVACLLAGYSLFYELSIVSVDLDHFHIIPDALISIVVNAKVLSSVLPQFLPVFVASIFTINHTETACFICCENVSFFSNILMNSKLKLFILSRMRILFAVWSIFFIY